MNLPDSIIKAIISKHTNADIFNSLKRVESLYLETQSKKDKANKIVQKAKNEANDILASIKCFHEFTTTYYDSSGNGDHEEQCLICGEFV